MINEINESIYAANKHNDRQFVTALARGMAVLAVFENSSTALSHNAVCERTGLPKATVSRLIYTLIRTGFIMQDPDGGYRLGINTVRISASAWAQYDIVRQARPAMEAFAAEYHVSVNLAKEEAGEMLYLACCRSPARLAVQLTVGSKVPVSLTAIGRAYYAVSDELQRKQLLRHLPEQKSDSSEKTLSILTQHTDFYQKNGYALSDGEFSDDILAAAVGIFNPAENRYTHALNASVPVSRWNRADFVRDIVPKLQELAKNISKNNTM